MPDISSRSQIIPLSPFRALVPYAQKAIAQGKKVYHLNIGQPDIETPAEALQKVKDMEVKILEYSPAAGIASYREKLVDYYKKFEVEITPEQILVTTGASEAIQFVLLSCLNAGEEVIIPEPFYANYNGFTQMFDVQVRPITCYIEDGFALPSATAFESVITDRTRAIMINNPNNPTGCFYPEKDLKALAELVKKYDLFLIVDEVYREFCYDDNHFFSALNLSNISDHVIVVDSISKRFSACGARIGTLISKNEKVISAALRYAKLRLSPPGLGQILAEALLDMNDDYINAVSAEYDRRRQVVFSRLQQMDGVVSYKPGGAFYCFARFPVKSAAHFCQWMLESFDHQGDTVMLSPGKAFYATPGLGEDEVRIAFVLHSQELDKAMDCLEEAIKVYPHRIEHPILSSS